jgi:Icc-related predicted phosphoesterase
VPSLRHGSKGRPTRIFFAADLHGSQMAFRKFVNAAAFYDVDALVFGGDLMGKALVPIVRENRRLRTRFQGIDEEVDAADLPQLTKRIEVAGFYWRLLERDEYEEMATDPLAVRGAFHELATARLQEWIELAEERLAGTHVRMYLTGGNDDEPSVLEALDSHHGDRVVAAEGQVVDLDDEHTMVTVGLSTPTPWDTPREASEEEIGAAIDATVAEVPDVGRCVFNLHCPPKGTVIDACVKLEDPAGLAPGEMPKPIREAGRTVTIGGGSVAVREAIRTYQPLVGLHGHIHESPGRIKIGRTPCFNPGSEYGQGQLQGVIVSLKVGRVSGYQHTSG